MDIPWRTGVGIRREAKQGASSLFPAVTFFWEEPTWSLAEWADVQERSKGLHIAPHAAVLARGSRQDSEAECSVSFSRVHVWSVLNGTHDS